MFEAVVQRPPEKVLRIVDSLYDIDRPDDAAELSLARWQWSGK